MAEPEIQAVATQLEGGFVDLDAAYKASNVQQVLDELDQELVGLVPVKRRLSEIAAMLLVARLRERRA